MGFMSNPAGGDGNFTVYVKYNAKAGRWSTKEDKPEAEDFEVSDMTAVFDMPNIKTGWFLFAPGVAPVKTFDPSLTEAAGKPGEGFKRGFELNVFSGKNLLGVREFSSTAGVVIEAMNALYDHWVAAPEAKAGKLPVVKCVKVHPVTNKHGTNYQPQLEIVSWVDRPAELGAASVAPAAQAPAAGPAQHVPPPAAKAPEPAAASSDVEF